MLNKTLTSPTNRSRSVPSGFETLVNRIAQRIAEAEVAALGKPGGQFEKLVRARRRNQETALLDDLRARCLAYDLLEIAEHALRIDHPAAVREVGARIDSWLRRSAGQPDAARMLAMVRMLAGVGFYAASMMSRAA